MSNKIKTNIFVLILLIVGTTFLISKGGPVIAIFPLLLPVFIGGVIIAWVVLHSIDRKAAQTPNHPLTDAERRRFNTTRILIILALVIFFIVSSLV